MLPVWCWPHCMLVRGAPNSDNRLINGQNAKRVNNRFQSFAKPVGTSTICLLKVFSFDIPTWIVVLYSCAFNTRWAAVANKKNGSQNVRRQADQFSSRGKWRILLYRIRSKCISITTALKPSRLYVIYTLFHLYFRSVTTYDCSVGLCTNVTRGCSAGPSQMTRENV